MGEFIICSKCGNKNLDSETYCTRCDASLEQVKKKRLMEEKLDVEKPILQKSYGDKQGTTTPGESHLKSVSTVGGGILIVALLLLVVAWVWVENVESQIRELNTPAKPIPQYSLASPTNPANPYDVSQAQDLADSALNAGRLWNLGVIIAVIGAVFVAFADVRK